MKNGRATGRTMLGVLLSVTLVATAACVMDETDEGEALPSSTVTHGELSATTVLRDGTYYTTVIESGRLVFEMEIETDQEGHGHTFTFRLYEEDGAVPLVDMLREEREGDVTSLEATSKFALVAHHMKTKERRAELGLPVEQDRPGCDAIYDSCGSNGQCCDDHDRCLEYHNDTSQSRADMRLRGSHNCTLGAFGCGAWHLLCSWCGGASDCCYIPYPDPPPNCLPYNTEVQCRDNLQCCNGIQGTCLDPYDYTWCGSGPNPEPGNLCQKFDAEFSTWGGPPYTEVHPSGYWSDARCGDGICSPGEHCGNYSSYDGNCSLDCGFCSGRYKVSSCGCAWDPNESGPNECSPTVDFCGDCACNGSETSATCPDDCGPPTPTTVSMSLASGETGQMPFAGTAGERISVVIDSTTVGSCSSGSLTIKKPDATTLAVTYTMCAGTILTSTLPTSGTYTVVVDPYGTTSGNVVVSLHRFADLSGLLPYGTTVDPAHLLSPGQRGVWTFAGTAGERVSVVVNSTTVGSCSSGATSILNPNGTTLAVTYTMCGGTILTATLPTTGTYSFVVDPGGITTGEASVTLHQVIDESELLPYGTMVNAYLGTPGERGVWTFAGTAGERVSVVVNSTTVGSCSSGATSILNPNGTTLAVTYTMCGGTILTSALPTTGTYTIVVDPGGITTGDVTVTLHQVVDATGLQPYGTTVTATLDTPGQRGVWTFAGTAGERVSVVVNSTTVGSCSSGATSILNPNGTTLAVTYTMCGSTILTSALPTTGTYSFIVDPGGVTIGDVSVSLYQVVDETGLQPYGATVNATLGTPGERGMWTFNGTAGERVSVVVNSTTVTSCSNGATSILNPNGTTLAVTYTMCGSTILTSALPTTGTYTFMVDPGGITTGDVTATLHQVVDETGLQPYGGTVNATLGTPGERGVWTFNGTAGGRVSVVVNSTTVTSCSNGATSILNPNGTTLVVTYTMCGSTILTSSLPTTGTYTFMVDPGGMTTGDVSVTLHQVVDVTGGVTVNGSSVSAGLGTPGQRALWTFSGTAGQSVSVRVLSTTVGSCSSGATSILNPNGTTLGVTYTMCGGTILTRTLPSTGTYTVVLDPGGITTGDVTASVTSP